MESILHYTQKISCLPVLEVCHCKQSHLKEMHPPAQASSTTLYIYHCMVACSAKVRIAQPRPPARIMFSDQPQFKYVPYLYIHIYMCSCIQVYHAIHARHNVIIGSAYLWLEHVSSTQHRLLERLIGIWLLRAETWRQAPSGESRARMAVPRSGVVASAPRTTKSPSTFHFCTLRSPARQIMSSFAQNLASVDIQLCTEHGSCALCRDGKVVGLANCCSFPTQRMDQVLPMQLAHIKRRRWN